MSEDDIYNIQTAIQDGTMTYLEIADRYGVSVRDVELLAEELVDIADAGMVADNDYFDDF